MARTLGEWVDAEVGAIREKPLTWLSHHHFFRDPPRPSFSDPTRFFSPADGVLLYQKTVDPGEAILDIKGRPYSLRDALRDPGFDKRSLVIGIFMTFHDVHINRIPYPGRLYYRELDPIDTHNHPMLDIERSLLDDLHVSTSDAEYLHNNQRIVNTVHSVHLPHPYFLLQVADYDVDCITPFRLKQGQPFMQGDRFSMIRFGSQVELIIPLSDRHRFVTLQEPGMHLEAGLDPLVAIEDLADTSKHGGDSSWSSPPLNPVS